VEAHKASADSAVASVTSADGETAGHDHDTSALIAEVAEIVNDAYDLGEVVRVVQVFGGYVNLSFSVTTRTSGGEHTYFVRKYCPGITEREVRFEHALLNHLDRKGFRLAGRVYETKVGSTFVGRQEIIAGKPTQRYFAVYEMLSGEDKYTWTQNRCTAREYESAAQTLALFHQVVADFEPGDLGRNQPPIMHLLRTLPDVLQRYAAQANGTRFDEYYLAHLPRIRAVIERGLEIEPLLHGLPFLAVHCDYHPGNLKYVDGRVTGLFDFDWSKLDYRLFDVALALVYFCSSWEGSDSGELRLDAAATFLGAYQGESAKAPTPGPLSATEIALLPRMMANANLYVLHWDVSAYYGPEVADDDEYLGYLEHNVLLMEFLESHQGELEQLTASVRLDGVSG